MNRKLICIQQMRKMEAKQEGLYLSQVDDGIIGNAIWANVVKIQFNKHE